MHVGAQRSKQCQVQMAQRYAGSDRIRWNRPNLKVVVISRASVQQSHHRKLITLMPATATGA